MMLDITNTVELENGGAELHMNMDEETKNYLINYAILDMIKKGLFEVEQLHKDKIKEEFYASSSVPSVL